jgi:hypothetical protein
MELYIITFIEQGHIIDQYVKPFKDIQQAGQFAVNQIQGYESFRIDRITEVDGYQVYLKEVDYEKNISAH